MGNVAKSGGLLVRADVFRDCTETNCGQGDCQKLKYIVNVLQNHLKNSAVFPEYVAVTVSKLTSCYNCAATLVPIITEHQDIL